MKALLLLGLSMFLINCGATESNLKSVETTVFSIEANKLSLKNCLELQMSDKKKFEVDCEEYIRNEDIVVSEEISTEEEEEEKENEQNPFHFGSSCPPCGMG